MSSPVPAYIILTSVHVCLCALKGVFLCIRRQVFSLPRNVYHLAGTKQYSPGLKTTSETPRILSICGSGRVRESKCFASPPMRFSEGGPKIHVFLSEVSDGLCN